MTSTQLVAIRSYAQQTYKKTLDPLHDFSHVERVAKTAMRIVEILQVKKEIDTNLLQAACYLHDIAFISHKQSLMMWFMETKYLKSMLPSILPQFKLSETDRYILSEAVYRHTWAFPFHFLNKKYSLYSQIVQDADMLEMVSNTRILGLNESKKLFRLYRFLTLFSGVFIKRIKRNMSSYLNLPEIWEYLQEE